ncbi:hypothetical protein CSC94_23335 [Zhengella mangrovi]|uniref:Uncharacterized protein n=1 Tax=Zhengella mangrovi TaxID=1982044 RepID=A0A2G1QGJ3_9HYPH|nr:hypothetical protein [Zhengella mangrovi]PHP64635.1 hypothetical protein CSC94_23335 [Zhengella mangrovi]
MSLLNFAVSLALGFLPDHVARANPEGVCTTGIRVMANEPGLKERVCRAAAHAFETMADCRILQPPEIEISVVSGIKENCVGVYHCGENRIEVLPPSAMVGLMEKTDFFAALEPGIYFDSVVTHELSHAAFASTPCPYPSCHVTSEYFAYAMQIRSLSKADRARIELGLDLTVKVPDKDIHDLLLVLAPADFARRVWQHISNQQNACAFLRKLIMGEKRFDRELN